MFSRRKRGAVGERGELPEPALPAGIGKVGIEGEAAPGTEILAGDKAAGWLATRAGDRALAWLRFDRAGADMTAGDARVSWTG